MNNDQAHRLALLLQAMDDLEREFAEQKTEFKDRMTRLANQAAMLRYEILSGQMTLVEPPPETPPKDAAA